MRKSIDFLLTVDAGKALYKLFREQLFPARSEGALRNSRTQQHSTINNDCAILSDVINLAN